ncbi:MAG: lipid-A-disaccharide synthase [candidate division Zixibacteria bacterium]|nr:lipid-A-disaccharide synthase [candidate division Zixibacteria bacterium]
MAARSICLVAGEPSGDLQGSLLISAMKRRHPDWQLWGVGSERMAKAGCELWQDARGWSVMGFAEVLKSLPRFHRRLTDLTAEIRRRKPDGVILIDFPGFNLKLVRRVRESGISVLYYIAPQIWAWGQKRVEIFRRYVDRTVVVFPFEKKFFADHGVTVDWVGHPLVDWVKPTAGREELRAHLGVGEGDKLVAILPGARVQDFESHLTVFRDAVARLGASMPGIRWALGLAPSLAQQAAGLSERPGPLPVTTAVYDLVAAADLVLTKSGTATVECALLGTPMVCAYRTGGLNFAIARRLVKVPYIAMPNLIAGQPIVPEFIQNAATPEALAQAARQLLTDPARYQRQQEGLADVCRLLGLPGAVERAVDVVEQWLQKDASPT